MGGNGNAQFAPEVEAAMAEGRPVVALETSVFSQGLPYPQNLEAHRRMRSAVEQEGAVPAVIAVLQGVVRVGLVEEEIRHIGESAAAKLNAQDLAVAIACGGDGALTVSATAAVAYRLGLRVVATGGIGGVHRGWSNTLDISADLAELARTPVAVITSGAKSVLDLPATLQVLETLGVPVVGYQTQVMPGFLVSDTGLVLEHQVEDGAQVARLLQAHWDMLGRSTAVVICNPCPRDHALDRATVDEAVERAVHQAEAAGVSGKDVTPFLLRRLDTLTEGASLQANLALLEHNCRVAAAVATARQALADSE
jgi:pseudouridine-5'-phosphate glycosidase